MESGFPLTTEDWDKRLTDHFLKIGRLGSGPIRSFEISNTTLAAAAGVQSNIEHASDAFRRALLRNESGLVGALKFGKKPLRGNDHPGTFAYLALTLLVDSLSEDEAHATQYGPKISNFLGINISNWSGVQEMWDSLKVWLDRRIKNGEPFRHLILPPTDGWSRIGHTARLSFPSRMDRTFIGHFFERHPELVNDDRALINELYSAMTGSGVRRGLKDAFREFHEEWQKGRRTIGQHRFWRLIMDIAATCGRDDEGNIIIEMFPDEDGILWFSISEDDEGGQSTAFANFSEATAALARSKRIPASKCIDAGFALFKRSGNAAWRAAGSITECRKSVMVAVSARLSSKISTKLGHLIESGREWFVTRDPVAVSIAESALAPFSKGINSDPVSTPKIVDAIHSHSRVLGRPSFLPRAFFGDTNDKIQIAAHADNPCTSKAFIEECPDDVDLRAIRSQSALDGRYVLSNSADDGSLLEVQFVADAIPHNETDIAEAPASIAEWGNLVEADIATETPRIGWAALSRGLGDTIEAIYAKGRGGITEGDLHRLLKRVLPQEINLWDFMRSLHESRFLEPSPRSQVRGYNWHLVKPSIVVVNSVARTTMVDGILCETMANGFKTFVSQNGGKPFRLRGKAEWALPIIGSVGIDPLKIADQFDWKVVKPRMPGTSRMAFPECKQGYEGFQRRSEWSWEATRMVADRVDPGSPSLERREDVGHRNHDVYVVTTATGELRFLSRQVAIACLHAKAGKPLFRYLDGHLVRIAKEGALPIQIAWWLRHATVANAAVFSGYNYSYPASPDQVEILRGIIPGLVEIDAVDGSRPIVAIAEARRFLRGGRLLMHEGKIGSSRTPYVLDGRFRN